MWEARAEYEDGTWIDQYFDYNDRMTDADQQYEIECWLLERHQKCTWYSVDYINE